MIRDDGSVWHRIKTILYLRPILSMILMLFFGVLAHLITLNYFGVHLLPRRSLVNIPLPEGLRDRGIFSDLDEGISVPVPLWISAEQFRLSKKGKLVALVVGDHVLALFSWGSQGFSSSDEAVLHSLLGERFQEAIKTMKRSRTEEKVWRDQDQDLIPDSLDIHLGLIKSMRNHARYNKHVHGVKDRLGDVPRGVGVCVDVAIRAYRNAGIDLQDLVFKDILRAPHAYERGVHFDRGYEHRRVRRLFPYFKRHHKRLNTHFKSEGTDQELWLPGDLLFMNFDPRNQWPDHVGLVSGYTQVSAYPLLAHNAATGFYAAEHDVLFFLPLIARFRITIGR